MWEMPSALQRKNDFKFLAAGDFPGGLMAKTPACFQRRSGAQVRPLFRELDHMCWGLSQKIKVSCSWSKGSFVGVGPCANRGHCGSRVPR